MKHKIHVGPLRLPVLPKQQVSSEVLDIFSSEHLICFPTAKF